MAYDPITLQEVWTRLDGRKLLYRTNSGPTPPGAPTLVHVHGFAVSGRYLMPTAWRLAPYYPTYVPDLPGFGRSQRPPHPFTIPELADALARFMDGVGVERAVLLGNSLGCPITAQFVHAHRDRIQGAIFCSPAGGIYNQPFLKGVSQLLRVLFREPLSLAPVTAGDYLHYGVLPSINLARSMLAQPTIQRIAEMTIPTLVVLGSRDPLVSESRARVIAPQLPHVTAVTIDGAAHALNWSHPEQLANVVRSWLEGRPIVDDPAVPGRLRIISLARDVEQVPQELAAAAT
jgi:pimeloyl-ACP methyl ester carboxylesterase